MEWPKVYRNPSGLTRAEFMEKHRDIPDIAAICWYVGVEPEKLRQELQILMTPTYEGRR